MGCRPCRDDEHDQILAIVNAAAAAYRGVIPADRWHEPYMSSGELENEVAAGVRFWGYEAEGRLLGGDVNRWSSATRRAPRPPAPPRGIHRRRG